MIKRWHLLMGAILFIGAAILLWIGAVMPLHAKEDTCTFFEQWVGGVPFDYKVDAQGEWNFPPDTEFWSSMSYPKSLVEKYYSKAQDTFYVIFYLSMEPTQPEGARLGQHQICVIQLTY